MSSKSNETKLDLNGIIGRVTKVQVMAFFRFKVVDVKHFLRKISYKLANNVKFKSLFMLQIK